MAKYNAAIDGGASPEQLQALAHDLELDGDYAQMWPGGTSAPIEIGLPTFMPGYDPDPAIALHGFFSSLRPTDIVNQQSVMEYYDAASRYAILQEAQNIGAGDVLRLYGAAAADSPRAILQAVGDGFDNFLNGPIVSQSALDYYANGMPSSGPPPTYMEFMTSIAKAATGITSIENMVAHHQSAMLALAAGDWDGAVGEAQGAMFEGTMAAATIAGNVGLLRSARGASVAGAANELRFVPINGATRTVPLGFQSEAQFTRAAQELQDALVASGIDDAVVGVRGSSVTGASYRTGAPFRPKSDIDFFIESGQLTSGLRTSGSIPGFVHPNRVMRSYPLVSDWSQRWSGALGRSVTPGAFVPGTVPAHPAILVQ